MLMTLFINIIYLIFIIITLPYYLFRIITRSSYRAGLGQRFGFVPKRTGDKPTIWLHCASVGEIAATENLIKGLRDKYPNYELVISTLTPTGQAIVKKKYPDLLSIFFPIDLSWIVKKTLKRIKPALIILMEQEIWPNFLITAGKVDIPVVLLNGRITKRSRRWYRLIKWLIKPALDKIRLFSLQTEEYAARYRSLGIPEQKIKVTGNMKYDISVDESEKKGLLKLFQAQEYGEIIIGGSTHPPEEEILIWVYERLKKDYPSLRLILAPRHIERVPEIENHLNARQHKYIKRSQLPADKNIKDSIVIIDALGELKRLYTISALAFIGGSLVRHGGQNILEPAAAGKPVLFGPHMYNFQEPADILLSAGAAWQVKDEHELYERLKWLLDNLDLAQKAGEAGKEALKKHQGTTERNLSLLKDFLQKNL
ncbi:3-deoxy-D-manno-octulosonic acid transferase [subsurface metagenome]